MGPRGFVNILDLILCDMSYQHCLLVCLAFMELRPWSDGADETLRHYMQTNKALWKSAEQITAPVCSRLAETRSRPFSETWGMRGNSGYSLEASARKPTPWG